MRATAGSASSDWYQRYLACPRKHLIGVFEDRGVQEEGRALRDADLVPERISKLAEDGALGEDALVGILCNRESYDQARTLARAKRASELD